MSRDLGRDVPDLEKLYARKLWADFSYPKNVSALKFDVAFSVPKLPSNFQNSNGLSTGSWLGNAWPPTGY